jgi:hypothetical protein
VAPPLPLCTGDASRTEIREARDRLRTPTDTQGGPTP